MLSDCTFSLMRMCFCSESYMSPLLYIHEYITTCTCSVSFHLGGVLALKQMFSGKTRVYITHSLWTSGYTSLWLAHFIQQVKAHKDQERLQLICKYTLDCRGYTIIYMCSLIHLWLGRILGQDLERLCDRVFSWLLRMYMVTELLFSCSFKKKKSLWSEVWGVPKECNF